MCKNWERESAIENPTPWLFPPKFTHLYLFSVHVFLFLNAERILVNIKINKILLILSFFNEQICVQITWKLFKA